MSCLERGTTSSRELLCLTPLRAVKGKSCTRRAKQKFSGSGVILRKMNTAVHCLVVSLWSFLCSELTVAQWRFTEHKYWHWTADIKGLGVSLWAKKCWGPVGGFPWLPPVLWIPYSALMIGWVTVLASTPYHYRQSFSFRNMSHPVGRLNNKDQLSLTNPHDALHFGERAANK